MAAGAKAVARGCGTRKAGGIYAELGLDPDGAPLADFLLDPPLPVDGLEVELAKVGVTAFEKDGVTHVLDWIGERYYPNVADFVEEVARFGLSRQIPSTFDFSKLEPRSRLICVHRRAWVRGFADLTFGPMTDGDETAGIRPCPTDNVRHAYDAKPAMCASIWWEDVDLGDPYMVPQETEFVSWMMKENGASVEHLKTGILKRMVHRKMPSFEYVGFSAPHDERPEYRPAAFASFPVGRLAVVRDPEGGKHVSARAKAEAANLEVEEVDE